VRQINPIREESRVILAGYLRRAILARSEVKEARMHADRSIAESKELMVAADAAMERYF